MSTAKTIAQLAAEALERLSTLSERIAVDMEGRVTFRPSSPDDKPPRFVAAIEIDGRMQVLATGETRRQTRTLATQELRQLGLSTLDILASRLVPVLDDETPDPDRFTREESMRIVNAMTPEQIAFLGYAADCSRDNMLEQLKAELAQTADTAARISRYSSNFNLPASLLPAWAIVRFIDDTHVHYIALGNSLGEMQRQCTIAAAASEDRAAEWHVIGLPIGKAMEAVLQMCPQCTYEPKLLEQIIEQVAKAERARASMEGQ